MISKFYSKIQKNFTLQVWTWGKGDYFRLGHGSDQHVRKPTIIETLRDKTIVHVSVGALHCLAVTDAGQVCKCSKQPLRATDL